MTEKLGRRILKKEISTWRGQSHQGLIEEFKFLNEKFFNSELPIPNQISFTNKFSRTGGQIYWSKPHGLWIFRIEVNKKQLRQNGWESVNNILLHEMCHLWELIETGDTSNKSRLFLWKLREVNGEFHCKETLTPIEFEWKRLAESEWSTKKEE